MKNRHLFLVLVLLLLLAALLIGIRILWPMATGAAPAAETTAATGVPTASPKPPVVTDPGPAFESHEEAEVPELELGDDTVIILDDTQGVGGF